VIGLPGGFGLALLAQRRRVTGTAADLARAVLVVSTCCLIAVWTVTSTVSLEARHAMAAGLCVLPLALAEGRRWWPQSTRVVRTTITVGCAGYVHLPAMYGVASVWAKAARFPDGYRPGASGLYNPLLATENAAAVTSRLQQSFHAGTDVWYVTEPMTSLD